VTLKLLKKSYYDKIKRLSKAEELSTKPLPPDLPSRYDMYAVLRNFYNRFFYDFKGLRVFDGYVHILRSFPLNVRLSGGRSALQDRNHFAINSMLHLGGSFVNYLNSALTEVRFGASVADTLVYLTRFNRDYGILPSRGLIDSVEILRSFGLEPGSIPRLTLSSVFTDRLHNETANPGPSYRFVGGIWKLDCARLAFMTARKILRRVSEQRHASYPYFGLAGRAKLTSYEKIYDNLSDGKPVGRAVWMSDTHESLISGMFSHPLTDYFSCSHRRVYLGFNKFGTSPSVFRRQMENYDFWISCDFSKFDSSISNVLMSKAFDVLRALYCTSDKYCYECLVLTYIESYFKETMMVLPNGSIIQKKGGLPSGSGLTSIIGSICNFVALDHACRHITGGVLGTHYDIAVCGDDAVVGIKSQMPSRRFPISGDAFLRELSNDLRSEFGMELSLDKTTVCHSLTVGIRVKGVRAERYRGMPLSTIECMYGGMPRSAYTLPYDDGGYVSQVRRWYDFSTHMPRLSYIFKGRVKFLSYYLRDDDLMIRPTSEVVSRLVNPEGSRVKLSDYIASLRSAMTENYNNFVTFKALQYLYIDATWLINNKVGRRTVMRDNYHMVHPDIPSVSIETRILKHDSRFANWICNKRVSDFSYEVHLRQVCNDLRAIYKGIALLHDHRESLLFREAFMVKRMSRKRMGVASIYRYSQDRESLSRLRGHLYLMGACLGPSARLPILDSALWGADESQLENLSDRLSSGDIAPVRFGHDPYRGICFYGESL